MTGLLIADDMPVIRSTVASLVAREKPELQPVIEACNGDEAVNLARQLQPDIVLMDIKMPVLDGLKATALIRAERPETKIIILTAYDEFTFAQQALKLGAVDYLLKPIRSAKLVAALSQVQAQIYQEQRASELLEPGPASLAEGGPAGPSIQSQPRLNPDRSSGSEVGENEAWSYPSQLERDLLDNIRLNHYPTSVELMLQLSRRLSEELVQLSPEAIHFEYARLITLAACAAIEAGAPSAEALHLSQRHVLALASAQGATEVEAWLLNSLAELMAAIEPASQLKSPVQQAMEYIHENLYRPDITLKEVAEAVNLSSSHLAYLFKTNLGVSYIKYLTLARIEQAKKLLCTTDLSISTVARMVGYQNLTNFYRLFERETKLTPAAYRRLA